MFLLKNYNKPFYVLEVEQKKIHEKCSCFLVHVNAEIVHYAIWLIIFSGFISRSCSILKDNMKGSLLLDISILLIWDNFH